MGIKTGIDWTNHTWSPWHGCAHRVLPDGTEHPGCFDCYAERMSGRNPATLGKWGDDGTRILAASQGWKNVRRWDELAEAAGKRETVFPSVCDPFEDWRGVVHDHRGNTLRVCHDCGEFQANDECCLNCQGANVGEMTLEHAREKLFWTIDETENLFWLLLTKRPELVETLWPARVFDYIHEAGRLNDYAENYRHNVALITSISDQKTAGMMLKGFGRLKRFVPILGASVEPLLGPIDFGCRCFVCDNSEPGGGRCRNCGKSADWRALDWIILGVESNGKRVGRLSADGSIKTEAEWLSVAAFIVVQCRKAGIPVFVKQIPAAGKIEKDVSKFPEYLQLREYPKAMVTA